MAINNKSTKNTKAKKFYSRKTTLKLRKRLNIIIVILVLFAVGFLCRKPFLSRFYEYKLSKPVEEKEAVISNGISIMGIDVSGMTKDKALKKITKKYKEPDFDYAYKIVSKDGKYEKIVSFENIGVFYDTENVVNKALSFANPKLSDNWFRDYKSIENGTINFSILKYDNEKIKNIVSQISKDVDIPMKDASVKKTDNKFVVTKSSIGYEINKEEIKNAILDNIKSLKFGEDIVFELKEVKPKHTSEDFSEINNVIGMYSSSYTRDDDNRVKNLKNACDKINGVVLYPNEEFSTNEKFNPCTEENGWRNAGTIVNGVIEDSIGGGMCQVSSALYMAVVEAELKVTERHNHSIKVNYMPYAYDAALAGDYKDLKFVNDTDKPIYIEAYLTSSKVFVKLYGKEIHSANRKIEFESEHISTEEPGEPVKKYDDELPEGTEKTDVTPLNGQTYKLYKNVYENGKLVDRVHINTSVYVPRREVILVGTKKETNEVE
ncbi:MAG: VanW family protein [Lachnospirales bacterium]